MRTGIFFLLFIGGFSAVSAQRKIDVLHYRYAITLSDANDSLYGVAEIKFLFLQTPASFSLDLKAKQPDGKGMIIDKITGPGISSYKKMTDSVLILLAPGTSITKGDTVVYSIHYHGVPADGLIISKNKYSKRTFFADNWPNRAHHWIPCVDDPGDKATVEFMVTAPDHYQIISNGIKIEESNLAGSKKLTHWKEDVPLPTKVMVIGVADFAVAHAGNVNGCIPISSWVYPENKEKGFYDYAIGKEVLEFYISYIGPYAYKKLANVQSKTIFGGMENAGAIFYAEETVNGKKDQERLFAHEIVHQWFGNMATEKNFSHFWLSEGFATYLSYIYLESKYGSSVLIEAMKQDRKQVLSFVKNYQRPVVDTTTDYMSLLNANSYQKGSWILHMLRTQLGDSVFHKAVRKYYEVYAGKNAETKDLQAIFESVSGSNLELFFQQWLFTNENPKLEIGWRYEADKKQAVLAIQQLQKKLFKFPLSIRLGSSKSDDTEIIKLNITKQKEEFIIPASYVVSLIEADPGVSLLAEVSLKQIK